MTEVKSLSVDALGANLTHFSLLATNWEQLQEKSAMKGTGTFYSLPAFVLAITYS